MNWRGRTLTVTQQEDHCRTILATYDVGQTLEADDRLFCEALFSRHPDAANKFGAGIKRIYVDRSPYRARRVQHAFFIERVDGTTTDISFRKCCRAWSPRQDTLRALRFSVQDQVLEVRSRAFRDIETPTCPLSGSPMSPWSCHVDHAPPNTFASLAERFIESEGGWECIAHSGGDGVGGRRMTDFHQELRWQNFHRTNAELRVVDATANLKAGAHDRKAAA